MAEFQLSQSGEGELEAVSRMILESEINAEASRKWNQDILWSRRHAWHIYYQKLPQGVRILHCPAEFSNESYLLSIQVEMKCSASSSCFAVTVWEYFPVSSLRQEGLKCRRGLKSQSWEYDT